MMVSSVGNESLEFEFGVESHDINVESFRPNNSIQVEYFFFATTQVLLTLPTLAI